MLVVRVQLVEVMHEAGLVEETALQFKGSDVVAISALYQPVQTEHIFDAGLGLEPDEHVVAEQQAIRADLDDVAADTVVLAADTETADHLQAAVAELGQALAVQLLGNGLQALALFAETAPQDFIGAALGYGLVDGIAGSLWCDGLGGRFGFGHQQVSGSRTAGRRCGRHGWAMAMAIAGWISARCRPRRSPRRARSLRPRRSAAVHCRPR